MPAPLRGKDFRVEHLMGMPVGIDLRGPAEALTGDRAEEILDACYASLRETDDLMSMWRPETPMARLSAGFAGVSEMPVAVVEVLRLCVRASAATGGWFSARRPDGVIDPTGLVKGWAVARVGRLLVEAGVRDWCVNAAGDVLVSGDARPDPGWTVGIADPRRPGELLDAVTLPAGGAVATSGTGERGGHIWDPRGGRGAEGVRAATVVCTGALGTGAAGAGFEPIVWADTLATAAVARGPGAAAWLDAVVGVEALVVHDDGRIHVTSGWSALAGY